MGHVSVAAVYYFLHVGGIVGDSHDAAHRGTIRLLSWRWYAQNTGTMRYGGGAVQAKRAWIISTCTMRINVAMSRWVVPLHSPSSYTRGIENALQFAQADRRWVRRALTVVGARIHAELNGVSCLDLETTPRARRSMTCSRSFGETVTTLDEVREAVALFTCRVAEKLRREQLSASVVTIFIETSRFASECERYAGSATHSLLYPTCATDELLAVALRATDAVYKPGYHYKKAGIMLHDMVPSHQMTTRMFHQDSWERSRKVSGVMDAINRRYGRHTIRYGSVETRGRWQMRAAHKSQGYTTRLDEVLAVDAGKIIVH